MGIEERAVVQMQIGVDKSPSRFHLKQRFQRN